VATRFALGTPSGAETMFIGGDRQVDCPQRNINKVAQENIVRASVNYHFN
jgi:hypothetical protein